MLGLSVSLPTEGFSRKTEAHINTFFSLLNFNEGNHMTAEETFMKFRLQFA
jgi:hypothetical protein